MKKFSLTNITASDRKAYPYYTDKSIQGILLIASLSKTAVLKAMRGRNNIYFKGILEAMGRGTNPNWITSECADRAFREDWIDDEEYDRLAK